MMSAAAPANATTTLNDRPTPWSRSAVASAESPADPGDPPVSHSVRYGHEAMALGISMRTAETAAIHGIGRHRRDGRRPSGKKRSRRIISVYAGTQDRVESHAVTSARGKE